MKSIVRICMFLPLLSGFLLMSSCGKEIIKPLYPNGGGNERPLNLYSGVLSSLGYPHITEPVLSTTVWALELGDGTLLRLEENERMLVADADPIGGVFYKKGDKVSLTGFIKTRYDLTGSPYKVLALGDAVYNPEDMVPDIVGNDSSLVGSIWKLIKFVDVNTGDEGVVDTFALSSPWVIFNTNGSVQGRCVNVLFGSYTLHNNLLSVAIEPTTEVYDQTGIETQFLNAMRAACVYVKKGDLLRVYYSGRRGYVEFKRSAE